jgi:hypothetical protein
MTHEKKGRSTCHYKENQKEKIGKFCEVFAQDVGQHSSPQQEAILRGF